MSIWTLTFPANQFVSKVLLEINCNLELIGRSIIATNFFLLAFAFLSPELNFFNYFPNLVLLSRIPFVVGRFTI